MFPDLVVVRKVGSEFVIDILEPHDPSLATTSRRLSGWRSLRKSTARCSGAFS
jgi:hypothetical protein